MPRKFHHRRQARPSRKSRFGFGLKPMTFVLVALVAVFGAGYLVQINIASSKGFQIRKLENQVSDLKAEGEKLELKVAQEQSVKAVEGKVQGMGMVPTPKIEYMNVSAPTVAQR